MYLPSLDERGHLVLFPPLNGCRVLAEAVEVI